MDFRHIFIFLFMNIVSFEATEYEPVINKIITILRSAARRHSSYGSILGVPSRVEDLPEAEPILPGHTLLRPTLGMLKSAIKFPLREKGNAVYGNIDNLSITFGKTSDRILYTGFRKSNNRLLESTILQAIRNIQMSNRNKKNGDVYIIEIEPYERKSNMETTLREMVSETENDASEILDGSSSEESSVNLRRSVVAEKPKAVVSAEIKEASKSGEPSSSSATSSESSGDSDYDKNPGNPYTVFKEKYKQNFLWNHFMDGDHMNLNPLAPKFKTPGPSGADLFFGRKWWYFNQDDYKPLR